MWRGWVLGSVSLGVLACSAQPEPLELPSDPAETGVPIGVRTVQVSGLNVELWYPAAEVHRGEGVLRPILVDNFIPPSVQTALGDIELPVMQTTAIENATLRVPETPYPVVLFSHGFRGMRVQSNDITTHLASRGYVVAATDHSGRSNTRLVALLILSPSGGV